MLLEWVSPLIGEEPQRVAPRVGFEPTTFRLTAERSTIELPRKNRCAL